MPVQSATFTNSLFEEKPAAPLQPLDPPSNEPALPPSGPEDTPLTPMDGPKLPAVFPVYAWI